MPLELHDGTPVARLAIEVIPVSGPNGDCHLRVLVDGSGAVRGEPPPPALQQRDRELERENVELAHLLSSVDIPIVLVGADRRVRRFTPGARALMNLIPSDIGRPLDDIKPNVDVHGIDGHIAEVLETGRVKELEVVDRAGRWHQMQIHPYRTADDSIDGAVISLIDIHQLKRAVGEATAALDQMAAVQRSIHVPLVVLDESFAVRSANPAYLEAFGGEQGEVVGRVWFDTCDQAWEIPELRAALAAALTTGDRVALEVELDHPLGTSRTIAVSGGVLRWGGEAPVILITALDVTEKVRLLHEADEARAQAVRASKSKDVFLATLSHELRGPLHTISLHADLLLAGAAGDARRAQGAAQSIARATAALERLIGDLIDVSAIIAGKISLKRRPVELQAVISAAHDAVRDAVAFKRIDLRLELDPAVGAVLGDDTRLQQVVGNLLGNAVKFTPPGGEISLELEEVAGFARIRISDSGEGIAAEFLPHVFDRFAQADDSNARTHGGLGLGLAIVRDLVRLHGGSVRAESDGPGTGATFTVDLPLLGRSRGRLSTDSDEDTDSSGHHQLAVGPAPQASLGDLDGLHILLVDDDPGPRDVLSEMLRFHGAEVRSVASASDAMAAIEEVQPDVLLCDIAMPDEDGYSLIQRIRALPPERGGQVPAVAITALATRSDRRRALAAGFHHHVAKPASISTLLEAVCRVVRPPLRPADSSG